MRGKYAQAANKHMMMIGCSVDYVRSGGKKNVQVTKAMEHLYATTAKFSGAYSWPHVVRTLTHHVGFNSFADNVSQKWEMSDNLRPPRPP
ncbi:hypothetical protein AVEN_34998-1 [Araneus ventricosus]|uniref:Uncharacterized protein n=1 Tax=Araneus ventricosus TaxID=182803 RepID=A0A4Y2DFF4_ARAVE|nr:hypothetical protein AVEN_34998-1 [Araneus ventricosus]